MLMNRQGQSMETDGIKYCVGMEIHCNETSDYAGLCGRILELRDGDDRESEDEMVDIVCELYVPESEDKLKNIESAFSKLYGRAVTVDDIGLDYVIMSPSMIDLQADSSEKNDSDDEEPDDVEIYKESEQPADSTDTKKAEHEAAEAKRKAEWEEKQAWKKAETDKTNLEITAMSDDDVMQASMKKTGDDIERLTRRNMKLCVNEHIQTVCLTNPAFARKILHPNKNMMNCFKYINQKAQEYLKQEMEMNEEKPVSGGYGGDVPDDMCYQWAEDYFNDPDAEVDRDKDDKFVPKPYYGGSSSSKKTKKEEAKQKTKPGVSEKAPAPQSGQIDLFGGESA